jgi:hypothetical protein
MPAPTTREDTRMAEQGETARQIAERCRCEWGDDEMAPERPCGCGQHDARLYRDAVWHWDGKHWTADCLIIALTAELARLRAEGEALRGALETFGSHRNGCPAVSVLMSTADPYRFRAAGPNCTCGLGAALAAPRAEDGTGR